MRNMSTSPKNLGREYPEIRHYAAGLPESIRDILLEGVEESPDAFISAIKKLRLKEEERNYVLNIQRNHGLACRPHESVKETMIRVRLKILRRRRSMGKKPIKGDGLPVDPFE